MYVCILGVIAIEFPSRTSSKELSTGVTTSRATLPHGRRVGEEKKTELRVVSGETNLIIHVETYQL